MDRANLVPKFQDADVVVAPPEGASWLALRRACASDGNVSCAPQLIRSRQILAVFGPIVFTYGSFFYLSAKNETRLVLPFAVLSISMCIGAAANGLYLRFLQLTNRILKAIELSGRESG